MNKERVVATLFLILLLILWQLLAQERGFVIPTPLAVLSSFFYLIKYPATWRNIAATTTRVYISLFLATLLGILFGVSAFFSKELSAVIAVVIQPIQYTAAAVVSIIAIVLFGLSPLAPYFVVIAAILPNIYVAVRVGLGEVRRELLELGRLYARNRWRLFRYIVLPQLAPYILIGVVRANAVAWKLAVTAEVFIAVDGLGFMINNYYKRLATSKLFAVVFIVILIGFFFDRVLSLLKARLFANYEVLGS